MLTARRTRPFGRASQSRSPLYHNESEVRGTPQLRDLTAAAARIFGWGDKDKPQTQINQLVITQEQLERMRALCDRPFKEPISERDAT
jgi:hypothetical protein